MRLVLRLGLLAPLVVGWIGAFATAEPGDGTEGCPGVPVQRAGSPTAGPGVRQAEVVVLDTFH